MINDLLSNNLLWINPSGFEINLLYICIYKGYNDFSAAILCSHTTNSKTAATILVSIFVDEITVGIRAPDN